MSKKFNQQDAAKVRQELEQALKIGLERALSRKLNQRVLNSSVEHDDLQPEGDHFRIVFNIETHPKKDPPPEKDQAPD